MDPKTEIFNLDDVSNENADFFGESDGENSMNDEQPNIADVGESSQDTNDADSDIYDDEDYVIDNDGVPVLPVELLRTDLGVDCKAKVEAAPPKELDEADFGSDSEREDGVDAGRRGGSDDDDDDDEPRGSSEGADEQEQEAKRRKIDVENSKRNLAKIAKNFGQAGISRDNKPIKKRTMRPACTCRSKCSSKIDESEREMLFKNFWQLGDHSRQWDYLARFVKSIEPKTRRVVLSPDETGRKQKTYIYYLMSDGERVKVCRTMFVNTFDINKQWIETVSRKTKASNGGFIAADMRGRHRNRPKRVPTDISNSVEEHINSFPAIETKCARTDPNKVYISSRLNVNKMYSLYKNWMTERNQSKIANVAYYRKTFKSGHNKAFHVAKRYWCDVCQRCKDARDPELKEQHRLHLEKKKAARNLANEDVKRAKSDHNVATLVFDIHKTYDMPKCPDPILYYKRKLTLYNFVLYDCVTRHSLSMIWNEAVGKGGPNEVASCLWSYMNELVSRGKKEINFITHNCCEQSRNRYLFTMYVKAAVDLGITISHRYIFTGHTKLPTELIHISIGRKARLTDIYTQEQWCAEMESSRSDKYHVRPVAQNQFFDFARLCNTKFWSALNIFGISLIKCFPDGKIECVYDYDENSRKTFQVSLSDFSDPLTQCYHGNCSVSNETKNDIIELCKRGVIPDMYHGYYYELLK